MLKLEHSIPKLLERMRLALLDLKVFIERRLPIEARHERDIRSRLQTEGFGQEPKPLVMTKLVRLSVGVGAWTLSPQPAINLGLAPPPSPQFHDLFLVSRFERLFGMTELRLAVTHHARRTRVDLVGEQLASDVRIDYRTKRKSVMINNLSKPRCVRCPCHGRGNEDAHCASFVYQEASRKLGLSPRLVNHVPQRGDEVVEALKGRLDCLVIDITNGRGDLQTSNRLFR